MKAKKKGKDTTEKNRNNQAQKVKKTNPNYHQYNTGNHQADPYLTRRSNVPTLGRNCLGKKKNGTQRIVEQLCDSNLDHLKSQNPKDKWPIQTIYGLTRNSEY